MIICKNISKSIAGKNILSSVSMQIVPGKISALLGPSGGGKSTLIRNLSLLEKPDEGEIKIEEIDFAFPSSNKFQGKSIHPFVTVVFQQFHLWPHLRVIDNLIMPLRQQSIEIDQKEFDYLIGYFEVDNLLMRFPHQISVGQKQRIAFIRAALLHPRYLFLDEVTSALDIQHVGKLMNYIKQLAERGTGILIATHLIGFAAKVADQIAFLNEGKIIEHGGKEILKNPQSEIFGKFLTYMEYAR